MAVSPVLVETAQSKAGTFSVKIDSVKFIRHIKAISNEGFLFFNGDFRYFDIIWVKYIIWFD